MKRTLTRQLESEMNAYISDWLDRNLKHVISPNYRGTVTRITPGSPITVQVQPQGEAGSDGHDLVVLTPGNPPQIGDLVDCYRRDSSTGYVAAVLSPTRPSGMTKVDEIIIGVTPGYIAPTTALSFPSSGAGIIPQWGTTLLLNLALRVNGAVAETTITLQFNGDTSSIYSQVFVQDAGAVVSGGNTTGLSSGGIGVYPGASAPASFPGLGELEVPGYARSDFYKGWHGRAVEQPAGGAATKLISMSGFWNNAAPVTLLKLLANSGSFVVGSRASLYIIP